MKLVWSPAALDDLKSAVDYVEYDLASPKAAERLYDSILEKAQLFANVPGAGVALRTLRGIDTGYRSMVIGNWMIFFMVDDGQALVVRILYGKSDYMRTLFGDGDQEENEGPYAGSGRQADAGSHSRGKGSQSR